MHEAYQSHAYDQASAHFRRIGFLVGQFYQGLIEGGVPEAEALEWTRDLMDKVVADLLGTVDDGTA